MNEENQIDTLAEEVSEALRETEEILPECGNADAAEELAILLKNQTYREALVRLYSVLLEVDMRNNPELYQGEE